MSHKVVRNVTSSLFSILFLQNMLGNLDLFVNFMVRNITYLCIIRAELIELISLSFMEVSNECI